MKKSNRYRPLLFVGGSLMFFVAFLWFLIGVGGKLKNAKEQLFNANNYQEIKKIWSDNYSSVGDDTEWIDLVGEKLTKLNLSDSEKIDLDSWYPFKTHLNLVVIPDLSSRLNKPDQIKYDKELIAYIWDKFKEYSESNNGSQNRLILEVTDENQANGSFSKFANDLVIDLTKTDGQRVKDFLKKKKGYFLSKVDELYNQGQSKIVGADYKRSIDRFLGQNEKPSTLSNKFKNKLIILTDGYLEITDGPFYTGYEQQLRMIRSGRASGQDLTSLINSQRLKIPLDRSIDLSNWEILVLEVRERENGDYEILQYLWKEWLEGMGAKVEFQIHLDASNKVKDIIDEFVFDNAKTTSISTPDLQRESPDPKNSSTPVRNVTEKDDSYAENCPEELYERLLSEGKGHMGDGNYTSAEIKFWDVQKLLNVHSCLDRTKAIGLQKEFTEKAEQFCNTYRNQPTLKYIPNNFYKMAAILQNQKPKKCL